MNHENENTYDVMGDMNLSTDKAKNAWKTWKRLVSTLAFQKWQLILAFTMATVAVILSLRAPHIFADAIDVIWTGVAPIMHGGEISIDFTRLWEIILLLLVIYGANALFSFFQEFIMAQVSQKLVLTLRRRVSRKLANVPLKFYDSRKKGEILTRVTNDLERLQEIMRDAIMRLFTSAITIIGAIILMFRINWIMTLIAIGAIFIGFVITAIVSVISNTYFTNRQKSVGVFNTKIEEYFSGQVEVKTLNLEGEAIGSTNESIHQLYKDDRKAQFIMFAIMPIIRLFNRIGYVFIAGIGASMIINGRISIGQIQAFFQYVSMSAEPMAEAGYVTNSLQSAIASAERVFELLDEEEEVTESTNPTVLDKPRGDIAFENVQFGYGDTLLMDGVSFSVKAGQKVAIVGPTGAGKTTLVNLLMRFYEVSGGTITVDGVDTRDFSREYLRSLFGMVLQDSWIFDGTVHENISYGRNSVMATSKNCGDTLPAEATREEVIKAAKLARADFFIRTLPKGYDTVMNDENATLSLGEKQLLCIVRAILANPYFLLLDEATSSVDTRTELHIQRAMDALMQGRTSFIIAHRLSTIKNADVILVMDHGTIVETGNHDELLQKGGMYAELYNSQFL